LHGKHLPVLPLRLGDLLQVQVPAQRHGISRSGLTSSVFITETLLDGLTFAVLGLVGIALLDVPGVLNDFIWAIMGGVVTGLLLAVLGAHLTVPAGWQPGRWLRWLPERARAALAEILPPFVVGLAALRHPRMGGQVLALSIVAWLLEGTMFWLFGLAFGLDLAFRLLPDMTRTTWSSRSRWRYSQRRALRGRRGEVVPSWAWRAPWPAVTPSRRIFSTSCGDFHRPHRHVVLGLRPQDIFYLRTPERTPATHRPEARRRRPDACPSTRLPACQTAGRTGRRVQGTDAPGQEDGSDSGNQGSRAEAASAVRRPRSRRL
jgi:hypothetical protein